MRTGAAGSGAPVLRPIRGFHAYYLIKTNDGATSVTVCDDRTGAEESNRVVAGWIKDKLPTFASQPPVITLGDVRIHLNSNQPEKLAI